MANKRDEAAEPSPESTWGAPEEAKQKWDTKYGKPARRAAEAEAKAEENPK